MDGWIDELIGRASEIADRDWSDNDSDNDDNDPSLNCMIIKR